MQDNGVARQRWYWRNGRWYHGESHGYRHGHREGGNRNGKERWGGDSGEQPGANSRGRWGQGGTDNWGSNTPNWDYEPGRGPPNGGRPPTNPVDYEEVDFNGNPVTSPDYANSGQSTSLSPNVNQRPGTDWIGVLPGEALTGLLNGLTPYKGNGTNPNDPFGLLSLLTGGGRKR